MENNINILLVDDNKEFCQLISEFFALKGDLNVVKTLNNGNQVLDYLENNEAPDLMILDLIMPHLDGVGVLEELNSKDIIKDMKIIALTAMGHDKIMKNVFDLGVHYYIMKPFDIDKLVERIRLLVNSDTDTSTQNLIEEDETELDGGDYKPYITEIIREIGVPSHIKGYRFVRYAVALVIDNIDLISAVTKELYPQVAEKFDSTSSRVERAIRHAIDVAWKRGNKEALEKYFSNNLNENAKPTNSQFIARIADEIMVELKV